MKKVKKWFQTDGGAVRLRDGGTESGGGQGRRDGEWRWAGTEGRRNVGTGELTIVTVGPADGFISWRRKVDVSETMRLN